MEITESFKQDIAPFFWVDHDETVYKRFLTLVQMKALKVVATIGVAWRKFF